MLLFIDRLVTKWSSAGSGGQLSVVVASLGFGCYFEANIIVSPDGKTC